MTANGAFCCCAYVTTDIDVHCAYVAGAAAIGSDSADGARAVQI